MMQASVAPAKAAEAPSGLHRRASLDPATVVGLVVGLGAVIFSFLLEGGHIEALVNVPAALIVFGGTFGATLLSSSPSIILKIPRLIAKAVMPSAIDEMEAIGLIASLAETARRDGLLALEARANALGDPFLQRGIQLVVDGAEPETVREVLALELEQMTLRHEEGYGVFTVMGGFAPTMGIIGTVMGLIHALGSTSDPSKLAGAIAVAFIATLYGVSSANLVWLPFGSKLRSISEREANLRRLMTQGLLAIQSGENPRTVREKLLGFLPPARRVQRNVKASAAKAIQEEAA